MTDRGLDSPLADALVGTRRFFTKAEVSADKRSLYAKGGRCLLYTSDAADERSRVDLGGHRIINKKK